jgi:hypothetical protein
MIEYTKSTKSAVSTVEQLSTERDVIETLIFFHATKCFSYPGSVSHLDECLV